MSIRETELETTLARSLEQIQRLELENKHLRDKVNILVKQALRGQKRAARRKADAAVAAGTGGEGKKAGKPRRPRLGG